MAPIAATALGLVATVKSFKGAVTAITEFGNVIDAGITNAKRSQLNPLVTDDPDEPDRATVFDTGELARFERFFAPRALTRAESAQELENAINSYQYLTSEYSEQYRLAKDVVTDSARIDGELKSSLDDSFEQLEDIPKKQDELITQLAKSFQSPIARISTPDTIEAGNPVTLTGTESGRLYDSPLNYRWEVTRPSADTNAAIATGQGSTFEITFPDPGTYQVALEVSVADSADSELTNRQTTTVTVESPPESQYTLTVTDNSEGSEVGSTTVTDSIPPAGGHIGFSTVGESADTADHGVIDSLRRQGESVNQIENWDQDQPLDAYNKTDEGGGRFERFFAQTTSGTTSLRVFSGCCGDTIVSTEQRVNLTGGEQLKVDLLQGTDFSDIFAHKTSVLIGTDAEASGGIKLELINNGSERTAGARIVTPGGTESQIEFDPPVDQFHTSRVDIATEFDSADETVTVGNQEVPTEFTTETDSGDRAVRADNAVEAINAFIGGNLPADIAVDVINAFIAS